MCGGNHNPGRSERRECNKQHLERFERQLLEYYIAYQYLHAQHNQWKFNAYVDNQYTRRRMPCSHQHSCGYC